MEFLKFLICFLPLMDAMLFDGFDKIPLGQDFVVEYTPTKEQQFISSINAFALGLLSYLPQPQPDNVCIPTFSVANMMSLFYLGSGGETEKELKESLQLTGESLDKAALAQLFSLSNDQLTSTKPRQYLYNTSHTILMDERVNLSGNFQYDSRESFRVPLTVIDFETEGKEATLSINWWISIRTKGYLNGIINEVDPKWDMISLDVAYFTGVWKNKFSRVNTQNRTFYNMGSPNNTVTIPMMRMTARLDYYGDDELQMIELPFRGELFSMFILLPRDFVGYQTLEEGFEHALEKAVFTMQERRVTVTIPKFHFNYSVNLTRSICDMGVATICKPGLLDFSEMVSKELVTMGGVLHKTFVEVSEEGMNLGDYGKEEKRKVVNENIFWKFEANHPFLFSIVDTRSGMILFLGSVKTIECEDCDSN